MSKRESHGSNVISLKSHTKQKHARKAPQVWVVYENADKGQGAQFIWIRPAGCYSSLEEFAKYADYDFDHAPNMLVNGKETVLKNDEQVKEYVQEKFPDLNIVGVAVLQ